MATMVRLDDEMQAKVEAMVSAGRFASNDEAFRAAVLLLHDEVLDVALTPEEILAVRAGLEDEAAGRVYDADEVFAELRARYDNR